MLCLARDGKKRRKKAIEKNETKRETPTTIMSLHTELLLLMASRTHREQQTRTRTVALEFLTILVLGLRNR